jgi:hypothetical protein
MEENKPVQVTRNQFLKLLIAGGSATAAAAFLPGKWLKPIVKVGVLPVHAQSSQPPITLTVSSLVISPVEFGFNTGMGKVMAEPVRPSFQKYPESTFYYYNGTFDYSDNEGEVTEDSGLTLTTTPATGSSESTPLTQDGAISDFGSISSGDAYSGVVSFHGKCPNTFWTLNSNPHLVVTLTTSDHRSADSNSAEIPLGEG